VSLRLRLALSYMIFLVPALVVFSAVVYFIASSRMYGALDDELLGRIDNVRLTLAGQNLAERDALFRSLAPIDDASTADFAFKVVSGDGQVLYAPSRVAAADLPDWHSLSKPDRAQTWGHGNSQIRVAYETYTDEGDSPVYVIGAVSFKQTDAAIDELRGVFIVLLTGAPAYYLAGRSLRPVREVAARAAAIERTGDFQNVLAEPSSRKDEMAELVHAFNAMVQRVNRMLVVQRDFLAQSSHELRRPLTVLRTYIDLLAHPNLAEESRESALVEMRREAESMSHLISDLLVLSREEEQQLAHQPVDFSALVERVVSRSRARAGPRQLSLQTEGAPIVIGDAEGLEQMVANLVDNAILYTPQAGRIAVAVAQENSAVRLTVTDTGAGIATDEQAHVFERFFRGRKAVEASPEGSGLGLVIVKHVAESHGGSVEFESEPGHGSKFVVELPAAPGAGPRFIPS
jgi:two-component system OmpR family sensor kinase